MNRTETITLNNAQRLLQQAAMRAGANEQVAMSLTRSIVDSMAIDYPDVALGRMISHLNALAAGRIKGDADPLVSRPATGVFRSDANGGIAQLGFDLAFDDLAAAARQMGLALFAQRNAFTCGALGYFPARLARRGLLALAATNGPAQLAGSGSRKPTFGTNPLAFAAPRTNGGILLIDQACSATAFFNVQNAANEGRPIPEGWAIDAEGQSTTDPAAAVTGALLPFGGSRGANLALMVEVLAGGLTDANWSLDAPSPHSGTCNPGSGLLIVAIDPKVLAPDFEPRLGDHLDRLARDFGVHIPGERKELSRITSEREGVRVNSVLLDRIRAFGAPSA